MTLSQLLEKFRSKSQQQNEDSIAIGSEAMHDSGLTDEETAGSATATSKKKKELYIRHNNLRPEEKIMHKQKHKTPI